MARKTARPGRTLVVFFLGLAIAFGLVALAGNWKPELGLDLQGGTSIRLTPKGNPSAESLDEARSIIDQRVNGSGVSEAEVTVEGNRYIVVDIPGESRRDLVETVKRQAQLRFRLVACSDSDPSRCQTGAATQQNPTAPDTSSGTGVEAPTAAPTDGATTGGSNRAPASYSKAKKPKAAATESPSATPTDAATDTATDTPTDTPTDTATDTASPGAEATPTSAPVIPSPPGGKDVDDPLKWIDAPNQEAIDAFNNFTCPQDGTPVNVEDDPKKPLVTCEWDPETKQAQKYLLSAAMIEGQDLDSASAQIPQNQVNYVVALDFNGTGTDAFSKISEALVCPSGTVPPCRQFAVVLDGQVLSAPTMNSLITNGQAQIEGNFTETSAKSLATSLKYGALPVTFSDFSVETVGPSLAGDQLSAGIKAGIIGLLLVMLYCLIYYRGLGIVVVGSLVVAGLTTYAMVLLLSKTAGFTLTLPGIAGLIVAVGITADSFIVYFERIRDEMRDGKSMRVAVEAGWVRARATCLAADSVSLLAAIVLYIFAAGVVRGFAFALGLSTIIDIVVFFWFTKPLVSVLARLHFFNSGGRWSGLSAETLGVDKIAADRPRAVVGATRATRSTTAEGGRA
ncbi:MAG TPA: protein translocase subunit SecD [Nocardioides sp.]|uniref:protein translocase subunit SecD n=1 Tax=Nocardioides sp. TaxID=35761 RepID=UPI002E32E628|nr:protein translocase subunit SecD [Nocardioides sp.]HEX5086983.1 protein translocase subunit SecD [Nocardioides sp.]